MIQAAQGGVYNLSMSLLGRGLVWMHLVVFVATISCALACPQFDVGQAASQTCSEPQSNGCCANPINGRCLECVETNFFEGSKPAAVAATVPLDACIQLTENYLLCPAFQLATYLLTEPIFLLNSALLI